MLVTLMHRDDEVLSFDYGPAQSQVSGLRPLEAAHLAPPHVFDGERHSARALGIFLHSRSIFHMREDHDLILRATNAANAVELALRAGGFSLFDQYWYRIEGSDKTWAGGNFYENDWDSAFGDAVFANDYDALRTADIAVPDVTCSGRALKTWVRADDGPRLVKQAHPEAGASVVGEVLASRAFARALDPGDFVEYELVRHKGKLCSSCLSMGTADEEFVPATQLILSASPARSGAARGSDEALLGTDSHLDDTDAVPSLEQCRDLLRATRLPGWEAHFAKFAVFSTLCLFKDRHSDNVGALRNVHTGGLRTSPIFDLEGAFATNVIGMPERLAKSPKAIALLLAWRFRELDPSWDYTWYDPCALEGFGDEVEATMAVEAGFSAEVARMYRVVFEEQLAYVNSVVARSR